MALPKKHLSPSVKLELFWNLPPLILSSGLVAILLFSGVARTQARSMGLTCVIPYAVTCRSDQG